MAQSYNLLMNRCFGDENELLARYHDEEWGKPVHDDRRLFEMLILEGAQAGLNWLTVLKKRENYRKAFDNFDALNISKYDEKKVEQLLQDEGIIRNRLKILAAIQNAKAFLKVQEEFGSFDKYIWRFTGGKPVINRWKLLKKIPARTAESDALSKDLQKRGFKFAGSTISYAFMEAVGMVNDHIATCWKKAK